jgi:uncharacterized protein (DUF885 family)
MRITIALLAGGVVLLSGCGAKRNDMSSFVEEYAEALNRWNPSGATALGFHQYDSQLEDRSAKAHAERIATLKVEKTKIEAIRQGALSPEEAIDAEMLDNAIQAELFDLETLATWRSNPMGYVALPGGAVDALMKRDFAPAKERLRSAVARLKGVPAVLEAMKANVSNPPKEFTDLSIRMASGSVGFFESDIALWAKGAAGDDAALLAEFTKVNGEAAAAMKSAAEWLKTDLLPRSNGNYAIGAKSFSRKLELEEMVDLPLEKILAIGEATLERDFQAFLKTAKEIDPKRDPSDVIRHMADDHPAASDLVDSCKRTVDATRQFLIDKKIVTVPSEVRPIIKETPPYARSGSFASMDTPGPFEEKAKEAYYYVTPVEADWTEKQKEEHLRLFNPPVMKMITVHEAFPGHYLQFLYMPMIASKTRKLTESGANVEGWAHYTEQMMIEQGFAQGDAKLRLAQLQEALIRDCRYVAGIKMHTQGWTVEQGTQLFLDKTLHGREVAFEEARRGAYNPTYLYYTLGKLMIYKLRADYQQQKGSAYKLEGFHNDFVKQGGVPLKLMRRILLNGDNGPLL